MVIDSLLLGDFVGAWRSQEPSPPQRGSCVAPGGGQPGFAYSSLEHPCVSMESMQAHPRGCV